MDDLRAAAARLLSGEKGEALCAEMNAWIADMRARGELDRILKKWTRQ